MESPSNPPRLRWFHLCIRDLLAATLVCAILAAWWSDRTRLKERTQRAEELAERLKADADIANASALSNREKAAGYDTVYHENIKLTR
jgi:hypothetical protein